MPKLSAQTALARPDDFIVGVSLGQYPGWRNLRVFLDYPNPPKDVLAEGWTGGGFRTLPTTPGVATIVSTSASDSPSGVGVRTVLVQGLDASYLEVAELVQLNGLVPVVTTQEFIRINRLITTSTGDLRVNVGRISAAVGGDPQMYIEPGICLSLTTSYCVPAGQTFIVREYSFHCSDPKGKFVKLFGQSCDASVTGTPWVTGVTIFLGPYQYNDDGLSAAIPGPRDLRNLILTDADIEGVSGHYAGYLVENDFL